MSELENFIKSNFGLNDPKKLRSILPLFKFSKVKKGENLLETDNRCKEMIFIQSGFLWMFNLTEGKEVLQWIASKGTFAFDLSSFYFETPSRWTIETLVDSKLYIISKNDYQSIVNFVPK